MQKQPGSKKPNLLPIYIAGSLLVTFSIVFLLEFINLSDDPAGTRDADLTGETYMDVVMPLLENAASGRGGELVEQYGCLACHAEDANLPAPHFIELASIAGERRPPLTAAAYVYESILYPGAFIVEGYSDIMPRTFEQQIPDEDLGDIMAFLLNEGV